jgi:hypothetical protein
MPPKAFKTKQAPIFQSDDEDSGHVDVAPTKTVPSKSDLVDSPKPVSQALGAEKDNYVRANSLSEPDPPPVKITGGDTKANIAELVTILTASNASMKGRIDDTGRFELKFELNRNKHRDHDKHNRRNYADRTPSPDSSVSSTRGSPTSVRKTARPGSKMIGWTK